MRDNPYTKALAQAHAELIDKGLYVEAGWKMFEELSLPDHASEDQRHDMRIAFYAGCQHLWAGLFACLEDGDDPTDTECSRMSKVFEELEKFTEEFKLHFSKTEGNA